VESPLANVCDTNYTSVAKIAKRYLGSAGAAVAGAAMAGAAMADTVMAGAHARLRELAAEYRG
jgi:hypothetical protein